MKKHIKKTSVILFGLMGLFLFGSDAKSVVAPPTCFDVNALAQCPEFKKACTDLKSCSTMNHNNPRCHINSANFNQVMAEYGCEPCVKARDLVKHERDRCQGILVQAAKPKPSPVPLSKAIPPGCHPDNLEFPAFTGVGTGCDLAKKNCPCTYEPCSHELLPYPLYEGFTAKEGTVWASKKTGNLIVFADFAGQEEYKYCAAKLCAKNQPEAVACMGPLWK